MNVSRKLFCDLKPYRLISGGKLSCDEPLAQVIACHSTRLMKFPTCIIVAILMCICVRAMEEVPPLLEWS